jgi:hypothetical protein
MAVLSCRHKPVACLSGKGDAVDGAFVLDLGLIYCYLVTINRRNVSWTDAAPILLPTLSRSQRTTAPFEQPVASLLLVPAIDLNFKI